MAIGKVGAYATLEGGIVDYGKMAYGAIDDVIKDNAIKAKLAQDKAEAAAKAKADRLKDLKDLNVYNGSGYANIDNPAQSLVVQHRDRIYSLAKKLESNQISRVDYDNALSRGNQDIALLNTTATAIKEKVKTVTDKKDDYMPEFYNPEVFKGLENVRPAIDDKGITRYFYTDSSTGDVKEYSNPMDIVSDAFDKMPLKVNIIEKSKAFKDVHDQDEIERLKGGLFITTKEKGDSLLAAAKQESASWVSDYNTRANLWSQYQQTLPENQRTGPKKDNFTKDEIVTLQKFAEDQLLNMYPEYQKVQQVNQRTGGDGDKDKNQLSVGTFDPSGSFTIKTGNTELDYGVGALSDGLSLTDPTNKKNEFVLKTLTLFEGGKKIGIASNPTIQNIVIDKQGRWVVEGSYVDTKSTTYKAKDGTIFDILDTAIDKVPRSEQAAFIEKKKELELSMAQGAEERKRFIQPVGESVVTYIINRLKKDKAVINGVRITNQNTLKQAMNYNEGSSVPTASNSEWISAGWTQPQINEAVKSGKIKVQ
jgi:hypothetical protein